MSHPGSDQASAGSPARRVPGQESTTSPGNGHQSTANRLPAAGVVPGAPGLVALSDPHRETLDRFIHTREQALGKWFQEKHAKNLVLYSDQIDSDPINDLWDHPCGDACEGDCGP